MNFDVKYDIGDEVWDLLTGKKEVITRIEVTKYSDHSMCVLYELNNRVGYVGEDEISKISRFKFREGDKVRLDSLDNGGDPTDLTLNGIYTLYSDESGDLTFIDDAGDTRDFEFWEHNTSLVK